MTSGQFYCIIATIYIAHDVTPSFRNFMGWFFMILALVVEFWPLWT